MKKILLLANLLCLQICMLFAQNWSLTGNSGLNPKINFIGTTDPIALRFRVNNQNSGILTSSSTSKITSFGYQSLYVNAGGIYNTAFGYGALSANTSGSNNTATGQGALRSNISGNYNTANGSGTLIVNTTGQNNTAYGFAALYFNLSGSNNIAVGKFASYGNQYGHNNIAIGNAALFHNTRGHDMVAVGDSALYNQAFGLYYGDTVYNNTAIGSKAMFANTSGYRNSAIGASSLYSNSSGSFNTGLGHYALYKNNIGFENTGIGASALYSNIDGNYNIAVGSGALADLKTGEENIAVGVSALQGSQSGFDNTAIGTFAGFGGGRSLSGTTILGAWSYCTANNQARVGSPFTTSVGGWEDWSNVSDGRIKKNVKENVPGISFINKLKPITYNLNLTAADNVTGISQKEKQAKVRIMASENFIEKSRMEKEKIIYTGFVAQDVEKAAKELNYDFSGVDAAKNESDLYGLRYAAFVVPLVKAVQELSELNGEKDAIIADQQNQLNTITERIKKLETQINSSTAVQGMAHLEQNTPNPFKDNTVIRYSVPSNSVNASISISNAVGQLLKTYTLTNKGVGSVTIHANELAAGNYYYTLIVDGKKVDSKKMMMLIK